MLMSPMEWHPKSQQDQALKEICNEWSKEGAKLKSHL